MTDLELLELKKSLSEKGSLPFLYFKKIMESLPDLIDEVLASRAAKKRDHETYEKT